MSSRRVLFRPAFFRITAALVAFGTAGVSAAGCQLVLPDGGGGSGTSSTGTGTSTGTSMTTKTCDQLCPPNGGTACDNTFKNRCVLLCQAFGTDKINCAENTPKDNTMCSTALAQSCGIDLCTTFKQVCGNNGQCNASGVCAIGWVAEAKRAQSHGAVCNGVLQDACNSLDKGCGELATFVGQHQDCQ